MADTYYYWTNQDYSTCTSSSTNSTWLTWTTPSYSTTASTDATWYTWTTTPEYTTDNVTWHKWTQPVEVQETLTEEEIQKRAAEQERMRLDNERRMAEYDAQRKLLEEKRKAADEKALQLLLDNLDDNQAEIYKRTGAIPVTGQSGKRYRIRKGTCRNVEEVDCKGCVIRHLCFHPKDSQIPVYDSMLTQKLMLELCEDMVGRVANYS
jgi:hypothetical protein